MENNKIKVEFYSLSINELFARNVVSCFLLRLNPSVSEVADIKTVQKLYRHLLSKGFTYDDAKSAVEKIKINNDEIE